MSTTWADAACSNAARFPFSALNFSIMVNINLTI
jgi:hypothetical protein